MYEEGEDHSHHKEDDASEKSPNGGDLEVFSADPLACHPKSTNARIKHRACVFGVEHPRERFFQKDERYGDRNTDNDRPLGDVHRSSFATQKELTAQGITFYGFCQL